MNVLLWIVQGLLTLMFLMAGAMKLSKSKKELREKLGDWVDQYTDISIKLIGLAELLGAVGLILPMAIGVLPILTPLAAIGLAMTMVGAMKVHYERKEKSKVITNIVLMLLAVFVVIGRLYLAPIV
ncbi:DoxX family protein [Cyclobacterium marinum]|uniref:DoxX family protein n=1 Tax=Cyclobacterium marinum (strain ATCC 25205 / DSM 745 / LMG 13164 / NCIMB 1802) TaxID=880070 RepID=G0J296_CYCMS|nr:DoxX family protein [Cyclobacterium marinum]AEL25170.1 DoxX family protein [Cyclobacterium marinum DSM 745]MBI0400758.1 DoxX family protein [Cyclobacterium marinum]